MPPSLEDYLSKNYANSQQQLILCPVPHGFSVVVHCVHKKALLGSTHTTDNEKQFTEFIDLLCYSVIIIGLNKGECVLHLHL